MAREEDIREAVNRLLRAAPNSRVILFGSHARGDARADSDVDFLVVEPEVEDRVAEMVRLRKALGRVPFAADVLVVSAERFEYWRDTPNTVIHRACAEGRVYESVA
jgi:predicted nucleotidyltransferase